MLAAPFRDNEHQSALSNLDKRNAVLLELELELDWISSVAARGPRPNASNSYEVYQSWER